MKVLIAADIHGNPAVYRYLGEMAKASDCQELWLAGDLLHSLNQDSHDVHDTRIWTTEMYGQAQKEDWEQYIKPIWDEINQSITIRGFWGNDDFVDIEYPNLHSKEVMVTIGGRTVLFWPHIEHVDWGLHRTMDTDLIKKKLETYHGRNISVVVTHQPPYGRLDIPAQRFISIGGKKIQEWIKDESKFHSDMLYEDGRPDEVDDWHTPLMFVTFGHCHEHGGGYTFHEGIGYYNCAVAREARNAVVLDLDTLLPSKPEPV